MGAVLPLASITPLAQVAQVPDLPVGLPAEPSAILLMLRIAALASGLALVLRCGRRSLAVAGAQALLAGLVLGLVLGPAWRLPAALVIAASCLAAGLAVAIWAPRLSSAWLAFWPLPVAYTGMVLGAGYLRPDPILALVLAAAGAAIGAAAPSTGSALAAAGLGATLVSLALGLGFRTAFALAVAILGLGLVARWRAARRVNWTLRFARRWRGLRWRRALGLGVAGLLAATAGLALVIPRVDPDQSPSAERIRRLRDAGRLQRPELVIGAANSAYLTGRAHPIALLGSSPGWGGRLELLTSGSSPLAAVHRLRGVKDDGELALMRRAAAITSQAFVELRPLVRPGVNEAEIERQIVSTFAARGATGLAFPPVVASGVRATRPHYQRNDATMTDGLVVIDIGCTVDGYASDMTRTFPVNGRPTAAELELLETVVAALEAAEAVLGPGVTMGEVGRAARSVIRDAGFGPYFTHSVGHHVGLAVHDPAQGTLEPGMVVTLEPGIYIPPGSPVEPSFWSLGVRVEDTFVVTADGSSALTDYPRLP